MSFYPHCLDINGIMLNGKPAFSVVLTIRKDGLDSGKEKVIKTEYMHIDGLLSWALHLAYRYGIEEGKKRKR